MIFFKRSKNQSNNKNTSVPKVHTIKKTPDDDVCLFFLRFLMGGCDDEDDGEDGDGDDFGLL